MAEEKIVIKAKRKRLLSKLAPELGELGFSRVDYTKNKLIVEKTQGEDLYGKKQLHYKIVFDKDSIAFIFSIPENVSRRSRILEVFPVLLNTVKLAEDYYEVIPSSLFEPVRELLGEVGRVIDKDVVDISSQLDSANEKLASLSRKYEDLVRSSEENARILLECERTRDELLKRINELEAVSDETIKEELFRWLKTHNGNLEVSEFSKAHKVPQRRVEEGLNMLIREGYIKKRVS